MYDKYQAINNLICTELKIDKINRSIVLIKKVTRLQHYLTLDRIGSLYERNLIQKHFVGRRFILIVCSHVK